MHVVLHWGPPQYSSKQSFTPPLPSHSGSDQVGEETPTGRRDSNKEEGKACLLDQEHSGLYNNKVCECIVSYLNLPKTPHLD